MLRHIILSYFKGMHIVSTNQHFFSLLGLQLFSTRVPKLDMLTWNQLRNQRFCEPAIAAKDSTVIPASPRRRCTHRLQTGHIPPIHPLLWVLCILFILCFIYTCRSQIYIYLPISDWILTVYKWVILWHFSNHLW